LNDPVGPAPKTRLKIRRRSAAITSEDAVLRPGIAGRKCGPAPAVLAPYNG